MLPGEASSKRAFGPVKGLWIWAQYGCQDDGVQVFGGLQGFKDLPVSGLAARLQNSGVSVIGVTFRSNGLALPALLVCNQLKLYLEIQAPQKVKVYPLDT